VGFVSNLCYAFHNIEESGYVSVMENVYGF